MSQSRTRVPLVTVGIPVYQGEKYLPETLAAAQAQDHPRLEILVSDNGSTDATQEICRRVAAEDDRVRYLRYDDNKGGTWNFNNLVRHAQGDFFSFNSADDLKLPRFVSACVAALEAAGPDYVLAFPRAQKIDEHSEVFEDLNDQELFIEQSTPHARMARFLDAQAAHLIYGLIRTDALRTTRGMQPLVGDDLSMLVELACRGPFVQVPEQLLRLRVHAAAFSASREGYDAFYRPGGHSRFSFPHTKFHLDLMRASLVSPIPAAEKARCLAATWRYWIIPQWMGPAGDLREALGVRWKPGTRARRG